MDRRRRSGRDIPLTGRPPNPLVRQIYVAMQAGSKPSLPPAGPGSIFDSFEHDPLRKDDELARDKVRIQFEGKTLTCRPGTSLAVALWECDIRHISHSHKFGRPRGVTCARGHCTACLMRVDGIPNVRTCELEVREGMAVKIQDAGAFYAPPLQKVLESAGHRFFPVGFYYKWFTRPPFLSRFFLDQLRPMTGVGRVPDSEVSLRPLPDAADSLPAAEDLGRFRTVVIGAGPSGLTAAAAAEGPVLLVDDHLEPGGQRRGALAALHDHEENLLDRLPVLAAAWDRSETAVARGAALRTGAFRGATKVIAGYHPDGLLLRHEGRILTARCDDLVWAAGALDAAGLFAGNDVPGIIGPRALYRLAVRDGLDLVGTRALVTGSGLDFWLSAALLAVRGASLDLVVTGTGDRDEVAAAVAAGWSLHTGLDLAGVRSRHLGLQAVFTPGLHAAKRLELEADLLVVCSPGKPAYDIPYQMGVPLALKQGRAAFGPRVHETGGSGGLVSTVEGGGRVLWVGEAAGESPVREVTS